MNTTIYIDRVELKDEMLRGKVVIVFQDMERNMLFNRYYMVSLENNNKKIPTGEYELKITYSPKFKKKLIQVMNVPKRSGIRIHPFNMAKESKGCITFGILGEKKHLIHTTIHCEFIQKLIEISEKATLKIIDNVYQSTEDNKSETEK